jgi:hypothetical protein
MKLLAAQLHPELVVDRQAKGGEQKLPTGLVYRSLKQRRL